MEVAKLVTFGRGRDTVYYSDAHSCSGYGSPEMPHAAEPHSEGHVIPDGCPVVDMREAVDTQEGFAWAIRGPMLSVDMAEGVEECPDPSPVMAFGLAQVPQYAGMMALQLAVKGAKAGPGPLDKVPLAVWIKGWKEHGARTGHYNAGRIVWDA